MKSVLESQPVYWMSLAAIPYSVLNKLRKVMFNFLWNGNSETHHYHLCRWETLSKPKKCGGWGFHNIFHFNKALAANTLWRVLMRDGIWHKVIKDKYLPFTTVINWFRSTSFQQTMASRIWNSLLKSVHLITNWLSWIPGSGHHVVLGRDKILGMGDRSFLSHTLISLLRQKNILLLSQARGQLDQVSTTTNWIRSNELGITGDLAAEWDQFRISTYWFRSLHQDKDDELMWTRGDSSGFLTVKNAYMALLSTQRLPSFGGWRLKVWKWDIQLKIKLFIWLAMENKILTWDNLQQKGWEGPSRCQLCKKETENISHLFIHCSFTKSVWERIQIGQKIKKVWEGNTLSDCFKNWTEDKSVPSI
jgi:hypothetical protein